MQVLVSLEGKDGLEELTGTLIGARMENLTMEENTENTGYHNTGHENNGMRGVHAHLSKGDRLVDELFEQMLAECQASSDDEGGIYHGEVSEEGRMKLEAEVDSLFLSCLTG